MVKTYLLTLAYDGTHYHGWQRQKGIVSVQECSPVDSFVRPEAWDMPGYDCKVIMAAGTFVGGATSELSADAPIREPYVAYFQGGLTYEHCRIACKRILEKLT